MQLAFAKRLDARRDTLDNLRDPLDNLRDPLDNLRDTLENLRDTLERFCEPSTKLPPGARPYDPPVPSVMTINYLHVRDDANLVTHGHLERFRNPANVLAVLQSFRALPLKVHE